MSSHSAISLTQVIPLGHISHPGVHTTSFGQSFWFFLHCVRSLLQFTKPSGHGVACGQWEASITQYRPLQSTALAKKT